MLELNFYFKKWSVNKYLYIYLILIQLRALFKTYTLDQEYNPERGLEIKSGGGDGMLQAVTHFYIVPGSLLVILSSYDTWYFDFPQNYDLFCKNK